ncbi:3-hydroxyanthranilate 3,4-dioxygenase [Balamuthia mandrillaris]
MAASSSTQPPPIDFPAYIEANKSLLQPPVCNKLIYANQLKVMIVGGPNIRSDYHIEEGEELFYQVKGDMLLKVIEQGRHKDIPIKQGQLFLLPPRIPHSPQRFADTVGLVIERERALREIDGLRWHVPTAEGEGGEVKVLYEEYFHCEDLGTQLKPVIERFHASEAHRTGVPNLEDGTVLREPPIRIDTSTVTASPVGLEEWLQTHEEELKGGKPVSMYEGNDFDVVFCGPNSTFHRPPHPKEIFFYQWKGNGTVQVDEAEEGTRLSSQHIHLVSSPDKGVDAKFDEDALCMVLMWK